MKTTRKYKRIFGILLIILCLCILIPLGSRILSRPETPASTAPTETEDAQTLEALLGADYVQFLTDTITMQMENRMDKDPEIQYYPIAQNAPLSDFSPIGENTQFELDGEGYLTIIFPAGTVTAPEHGEQRFRIIRIEQK